LQLYRAIELIRLVLRSSLTVPTLAGCFVGCGDGSLLFGKPDIQRGLEMAARSVFRLAILAAFGRKLKENFSALGLLKQDAIHVAVERVEKENVIRVVRSEHRRHIKKVVSVGKEIRPAVGCVMAR
jgi:hypothetical protein